MGDDSQLENDSVSEATFEVGRWAASYLSDYYSPGKLARDSTPHRHLLGTLFLLAITKEKNGLHGDVGLDLTN